MQRLLIALIVLSSLPTSASDVCPQLEGTFRCRSAEPFELSIKESAQQNFKVYQLTDPTGDRSVVADGLPHEMNFRDGAKGQYIARCDGHSLILEAHSPKGEILLDRYYIERAGLVRVRLNKTTQTASSLSCAPTKGTWRIYQH